MGQLVNGRIVNEAAQSGEPCSVRDHGDNAPFLGCCEDGISLDCFCPLAILGLFGAHGSIVNMGISISLDVRICLYDSLRTYVIFSLSQFHNWKASKSHYKYTLPQAVFIYTYSVNTPSRDEETAKKKQKKSES